MGLRIQNNVEAFNTHRQLTATAANAASKSMEKLSSRLPHQPCRRRRGRPRHLARRCAARSAASPRRSATRRTASRSCRPAEGALNEVHSMLQRVRDLKVQFDNGTLSADDQDAIVVRGQRRSPRRSSDIADETKFNGIELLDGTRPFTFQVGANDGETIAVTRRTSARSSPPAACRTHGRRRRRPRRGLGRRRSTARCRVDDDRHGDQERLDGSRRLRRGAEPPRAPPEQPGDLPGEPDGVREPDPRRGHGRGDDQVHEAATSCSRPARACSRRPTRPRRASSRSCARASHNRGLHGHGASFITPPRDGSRTGGFAEPPVCVKRDSTSGTRLPMTGTCPPVPSLAIVPRTCASAEELDVLLRCLVSLRVDRSATPWCSSSTTTAPTASSVADLRGRLRRARRDRRLQGREHGLRPTVNVGLRDRPRPRAATPSWSTPTSSSTRPAGSSACSPAPTRRAARPPSSAPGCSTRNGLHPARGHLLLAAAAATSSTASSTGPPTCPRRSAPDALPRHRRPAADPPRDARDRRPLRRGLPPRAARTSTTACACSTPASSASTSRPPCAVHLESFFRGGDSRTEQMTDWSLKSLAAAHAQVRHHRLQPVHPGAPVSRTDLPKTLFLVRGAGGAGWYRCALPAMALGLEWLGVQSEPPNLQFVTGLTKGRLSVEDLESYDVLVVQQPSGTDWTREIRRLQDAGVKVLFEIDDYVQAVRKMADHEFSGHFGKDIVRSYELNMRHRRRPDLLDRLPGRALPRVQPERLGVPQRHRPRVATPSRSPSASTVTIGWAGGTGHKEALQPWLGVVAEILREHENVRFVSIGAARRARPDRRVRPRPRDVAAVRRRSRSTRRR